MTRTHLPRAAKRTALYATAATALAILLTNIASAGAATQSWEQGTVASDLLATDSPSTSNSSGNVGATAPFFFGFLEFDWDPNAPGGVPGFGPLPEARP